MTWDEYGMFTWLCTKANARTGSVRTSWPMLGEQTGLTANHVEKLCRALKRKRYVWYPVHRGARGRLVDVAIHKYPLAHGSYTDLSPRFAAEVPAEVLADVTGGSARPGARALARRSWRTFRRNSRDETVEKSRGSPPGRRETENRDKTETETRVPCARASAHGARAGQSSPRGEEIATPVAIRELLADPALVATVGGWPPESDRGGSRRHARRSPMNAGRERRPEAARRDEPTATRRAAGTRSPRRGTTGGSNWFRGAPRPARSAATASGTRIDGRWPRGPRGSRPARASRSTPSDLTPCPHQEASA